VYRSAILPRFLGVLLLVSFAAELGLALWLLLKGVKRI
jgi:hypothetical protein